MRFLLPLVWTALAWAQTPPKLTYVVILSRHGVRAPTGTNESVAQYAADAWPEWSAPPGELTAHGGKLLEILGGWYRGWLAKDGLVPGTGCDGAESVHVRADVGQRTRESAKALAKGMFPGCELATNTVDGDTDPLFHPVTAGQAHGDAGLAEAAVSGRIGNHPEALAGTLQHAFGTLREVLFGCGIDGPCALEKQPGKQGLLDLPASVSGTADGLADLRGPVRTGSTMAENLLLEYAEGMSGKNLGWGRLDEAKLNEVMAIHTTYADLARKTGYLARVQGSNLMSHILRSLEQAIAGKAIAGALGKPGDRVLLLGGHDTNISHLAGMLNLSWLLPGFQRDDIPPGSALVFRLWHDAGGYRVETLFLSQTLEQMRLATPLGAGSSPAIAPVFVPGCAGNGCGWEKFRQIVSAELDPQ